MQRRAVLIGSGAALVAGGGFLRPQMSAAADGEGAAYLEGQQQKLIDTYWQELTADRDAAMKQFEAAAASMAAEVKAPPEAATQYIDLAHELQDGRVVTLLPQTVEAVPVGLAKLSDTAAHAARFVMPFLAGGPVGGAFKVLDLTFKAASWLAASTPFRFNARSVLNKTLIPTRKSSYEGWKYRVSDVTVEGLVHRTSLGQLFVSKEEHIVPRDEFDVGPDQLRHLVGLRLDTDPASMNLLPVRLVET